MVTLSFRTKCLDVEAGEEAGPGTGSAGKWLGPNADLARLFTSAYTALCVKIRRFAPCTVCAMRTSLEVCDNGVVELLLTGECVVGRAAVVGGGVERTVCILPPCRWALILPL
jgi:hypothetical protein